MKATLTTTSSRTHGKALAPPAPRPATRGDDRALSAAWKILREHPLPAVGALAAGLSAYAVISHMTNGKARRAKQALAARSRRS